MTGSRSKYGVSPPPGPIDRSHSPRQQSHHYPPPSSRPRKPMDRTAVIGIGITSICFVMLFVALFAPWFTVRGRDYNDYYWEDYDDEPAYEWKSYDYSGEAYGSGKDDMKMEYHYFDSLDNGKMQGFWGIILGVLFGSGLIVFGNIHLRDGLPRKLMVFFRGLTGIILLLPATFLMVCGSKFTGVSISISTEGSSSSETVVLTIVPYILFLVGIVIFIMAFGLITYNMKRLRRMPGDIKSNRGMETRRFTVKFKKISVMLVILSMLALVTLPLLPIVSETEGKSNDFLSSGLLLCDEFMDEFDFASYLGWVNFAFWFIFPLALLTFLAVMFLESGINDLTGYVLGLIPTLIAMFLVLGLIFKILFIVDVFDNEYGDIWYGYNYFPLLIMIGLTVTCILYMIHTIKGSMLYFRSMPRRSVPVSYVSSPVIRDRLEDRRALEYPPPPGYGAHPRKRGDEFNPPSF